MAGNQLRTTSNQNSAQEVESLRDSPSHTTPTEDGDSVDNEESHDAFKKKNDESDIGINDKEDLVIS